MNSIVEKNLIDSSNSTAERWDGKPKTLGPKETVHLQSPNGEIIIAYTNTSEINNVANLSVTAGGSFHQTLAAQANQNAPSIIIENFGSNIVSLSNRSAQSDIEITAYAPGFDKSGELPDDAIFHDLAPYQSLKAITKTRFQELTLKAEQDYTIFGVFVGTDAQVYCVNTPSDAGVPVEDYSKVVPDNKYKIEKNFRGKTLYVVNLSAQTAEGATVNLQSE
ncbi:MAG: hypothetical protein ACI8WB_002266 [Phenylobacterium sp.]|jgi:hypothetical protein